VNEAALLAAQRDASAITMPMIDYAYDKVGQRLVGGR
jgi:ATP-dependent Zn protease